MELDARDERSTSCATGARAEVERQEWGLDEAGREGHSPGHRARAGACAVGSRAAGGGARRGEARETPSCATGARACVPAREQRGRRGKLDEERRERGGRECLRCAGGLWTHTCSMTAPCRASRACSYTRLVKHVN